MNMKRFVKNLVLTMVIAAFTLSSTALAADPANSGFSDTGSHWAKDYIKYLTDNGAIKGYTDGTFKPENKITRAEFTAILLRALKKDVGQPKEGKWYENYVTEATNRKYILKGEFDSVEKNITRGEMARMIVRAMTEEYPANMADYASQLSDYSKTPEVYKDFVLKAYVKGIITGRPGGIFAYAEPAFRAEATTMIVRLIDTEKRVIPAEPENNEVYMYEIGTKTEMEVKSSHPELIPQIEKAIDIFKGYPADIYYSKEGNSVQFFLFKDKEELQKNILEQVPILEYSIDTEQIKGAQEYLPYSLTLFDAKSTTGQDIFKALAKEIFLKANDKVQKELQNKLNNVTYKKRLSEHINGREVRIFTAANKYQISVYAELENK